MPKRVDPPKPLWAYAYQIVTPRTEDRLSTIKTIIENAQVRARGRARRWIGRIVLEERATHIMVVTDSPDQDDDVNRLLEAELAKLNVSFRLTAPLAATDAGEPPSPEPP